MKRLRILSFLVLILGLAMIISNCGGGGSSGVVPDPTVNIPTATVNPGNPTPTVNSTAVPTPTTQTGSVVQNDNTYVAYGPLSSGSSLNGQAGSFKNLLVLPYNSNPPSGYTRLISIYASITDPNGIYSTNLTIDQNGYFNLDNANTWGNDTVNVNITGTTTGSGVTVQLPVIDPNGPVNAGTLTDVKIVPQVRYAVTGETIYYILVGINNEGKKVKPSNVTWSTSGGTITPLSSGSASATFISQSAGDFSITAKVTDPNTSIELTSTAKVSVIDSSSVATITGTLYDADGITPLANTLIVFEALPAAACSPGFSKASMSDGSGKYTVYLLPGRLFYISVRNSSDKKFYEGVTFTKGTLTSPESGGTLNTDIKRTTTLYASPLKPLYPVERYIRGSWFYVSRVLDRHLAAIHHELRLAIADPNTPSTGTIGKGEFRGGTYRLTRNGNAWTLVIINNVKHRKLDLAYDGTSKYTGTLWFNPFDITNSANNQYTLKVKSSEWTKSGNTYTGTVNHYNKRYQNTPFAITDFTFTANADGSQNETAKWWGPDKNKQLSNFVDNRSAMIDPNTLTGKLFDYTGYLELYLYELSNGSSSSPSQTLKYVLKDGSCYINKDLSGAFYLTDETSGGIHTGAHIEINIDAEKTDNIDTSVIATGSVYNKEGTKIADFKIYFSGIIEVTNLETGTIMKFNL